jgi:hypothetical protein
MGKNSDCSPIFYLTGIPAYSVSKDYGFISKDDRTPIKYFLLPVTEFFALEVMFHRLKVLKQ